MKYVPFVCKCCKGVWRTRVEFPRPISDGFPIRMTGWCRRCGRGDCSRPGRTDCNERSTKTAVAS